MAAPQTSVGVMPIGVEGDLADEWTVMNGAVDSATSEETTAEIPFGVAVKAGTAASSMKLLTAITETVNGVLVYEPDFAKPSQLGDTGIKPKVTARLLRFGRILVIPEDTVTEASGVFVRAVATTGERAGAFRGTADGTDTIDVSAFFRWRRGGGSAGTLCELEVNLIGA